MSFIGNVELVPPAAFERQILLRKNKIPEEKRVKAETAIDHKNSIHNSGLGCEFPQVFPLKIPEVQQSYLCTCNQTGDGK